MPAPKVLPERLTDKQWIVLSELRREWSKSPHGIKSATLLSLQARGLVQRRVNPEHGMRAALDFPYTSFAWQWRLSRS